MDWVRARLSELSRWAPRGMIGLRVVTCSAIPLTRRELRAAKLSRGDLNYMRKTVSLAMFT